MNTPSVITLPLSGVENMEMELAWRFSDLLDQIGDILKYLKELTIELLENTL